MAGGGSCGDDDQYLLLSMSEDVLIQILLWLPVISLLRFKSVCKSWRSIIESTFFIHLHAATTTKLGGGGGGGCSSSSSVLIINLDARDKKGNNILTLSGEEFEFFDYLGIPATTLLEYLIGGGGGGGSSEEEEFEWFKRLEEYVEFSAVGCCDGIICLHDYFSRNVALWNPATKQSRVLPKPSNLLGCSECFAKSYSKSFVDDDDDDGFVSEDFFRFGIDIKTNDYKLLLITTFKPGSTYFGNEPDEEDNFKYKKRFSRSEDYESPYRRRVHVYSLSTDSWKCIDNATLSAATHPDLVIDIKTNSNQGLYLNGSYFFTANCFTEDMSFFLSFDFTEEIFKTIQPPPFDVSNRIYNSSSFIGLGGKVALVNYRVHKYVYYEYVIWVLNEQQQHSGTKEESWTKFYTIGPPSKIPNQPIFITNNGEFAITYGMHWQDDQTRQHVLQLLNLITGEKKLLQCDIKCMNRNFVLVYKPSLMPIGGNGAR